MRVILGVGLAFVATAAPALPPPADSRDATYLWVDTVLKRVEDLPAPSLRDGATSARAQCRGETSEGSATSAETCAEALADLFDRVQAQRSPDDPLRDAALAGSARRLGDAITRLAHFKNTSGCDAASTCAAAIPARIVLAPDTRHVDIKPLVPLRGARRYAVVIEGMPHAAAPETRLGPAGVVGFPSGLGRIDIPRAEELLSRLQHAQAALPLSGNFAGTRAVLPKSLRGEDLRKMRAYFAPITGLEPPGTIQTIRTLDARRGLRENRARLRALPCTTEDTVLEPGPQLSGAPAGTTSLVGRFPSLNVIGDPTWADALGVPAAKAGGIELDYRLLLPPSFATSTPLVLAVDGHMGSAHRMLARHGAELLAEGLAVLVIDLPAHGTRARAGVDIVTPLDPARLSRSLRQAATDVVAAVREAVVCGFRAGEGGFYRPTEVRYLGYSLGGIVGSIARSVEPDLGTTVLIAPGGDLMGWLMLRVGAALGARYVGCLGGPEHGETCIDDGACAAPGHCVVDPFFEQLYLWLGQPYSTITAAGDPLSFATERTGETSKAPLLIITGGRDPALHPALAGHLADAYGMRVTGPHERRGPNARLVEWPAMAHDLPDHEGPRRQAHRFLGTNGRRIPGAAPGEARPR